MKKHSDKLQTLLYQLFSYSASGATLDNLINTSTSRTERVSLAMRNVFTNPTEFLEGYNKHISNSYKTKHNNVVALKKDKFENKSEDEDWDL